MICYLFPEPTYIFFSPDVPQLLYYLQLPATIVALFLGFYAFWKGRQFLINRLLLAISICFSLWTLVTLIAWTNIHSNLIMFVWSFFGLILGSISILCVYFISVFLEKGDVSFRTKLVFLSLLTPILLLAPTALNLTGFNITACDAFEFEWLPFKIYHTLLGVLAMVWILTLLVRRYHTATPDFRRQIVLMGIGIEFFLFSFFGMEFVATYLTRIGILPDSQLELYGLFGMVIFMIYITILIVRFGAFNVKLLGTQALVWAQIILIGSQFFFVRNNTNRVLTAVTLVVSAWLGLIIVRSVKKEVEARETIEGLAKKLEGANTELEGANEKLKKLDQQKSEFVSIASHQLRSPLTVIKGYLSMFLEGEPELADTKAGTITPKGVEVMKTMFESTNRLAHIIEDFLNVSRIEQGRMKYEMSDFDVRHMATDVVNELKGQVADHKLTLDFKDKTPSESYMVKADSGKLRQVIANVIDNSIKYTPQGGITVYLERLKDSIRISVKDTGIGISAENLKNLFQKFNRAANAGKVNVTGSGLGLFVAIEIMKAHGGKLWAESEGEGKGSTFVIELPLNTQK